MIGLSVWGLSASASAQRPTIDVTLEVGCGDLDETIVRRVLEVELGEYAQLDAEDPEAQVAVSCATPIFVLTLTEAASDRRLARELEIDAVSGRSRLVALAISELIAASWIVTERRAEPVVVVPPLPPAVETVTEPAATEEVAAPVDVIQPAPIGIRIFGLGRISGEPIHFSGGGGVGFDAELLEPVAFSLDAQVTRGRVETTPGAVDLTAITLGAFIAIRAPFDRSHADIGLGVRGGAGVLEGRASEATAGQVVVGPVVSVAANTLLSLHLVGTAYAHVGLELGWTVVGVTGTLATTGETLARLGGAYIALGVGFEIRPGR